MAQAAGTARAISEVFLTTIKLIGQESACVPRSDVDDDPAHLPRRAPAPSRVRCPTGEAEIETRPRTGTEAS